MLGCLASKSVFFHYMEGRSLATWVLSKLVPKCKWDFFLRPNSTRNWNSQLCELGYDCRKCLKFCVCRIGLSSQVYRWERKPALPILYSLLIFDKETLFPNIQANPVPRPVCGVHRFHLFTCLFLEHRQVQAPDLALLSTWACGGETRTRGACLQSLRSLFWKRLASVATWTVSEHPCECGKGRLPITIMWVALFFRIRGCVPVKIWGYLWLGKQETRVLMGSISPASGDISILNSRGTCCEGGLGAGSRTDAWGPTSLSRQSSKCD